MSKDHFLYGASYSPLVFSEEDWKQDLANMKVNHINLLRIGDVHGSWDRLEPIEGVYRFEVLEKFYKTAESYNIDILLCAGTSSPPLWLAKKYPDISILSSRGEKYPLGASYHWACIHHPGFIQAAQNYISNLVNFALTHTNHFGWQISNEVGFPFLPAREKNELGLYCYCAYCQQEFREWVKNKYKSLEALTEVWMWGTSGLVYNDWQDIFAPESMPSSWAGVTRWIDWRLFWQESFTRFINWQVQLIKQTDKNHPTSVNTFNFKGFDRFGTFMGLDQWKIAKVVDHIGYDLYPGSGNKLKSRPEHNSMFLDHGRSVAAVNGQDFWIHEVESGPIGGWLMGPEHNTNSADIYNYVIETLGHNAKLILYMPWREWDYQPLHWGALVDLEGNKTDRLQSAGELGKFICSNASFLNKAKIPISEVALLESKANAIFLRGVDQEEMLFNAQRGAYRAFWERGFSVDFINTPNMSEMDISKYRLICLPLMGLLSNDDAKHLESYVRNGGVLIAFSRCATLDEKGWYHHHLPINGLDKVFGLHNIRADTLEEPEIYLNGKEYHGWLNRDIVEPLDDTDILATFKGGVPAVVIAKHGKGHGVYIATQADGGYLQPNGQILDEVINEICKRIHLHPRAWFENGISRLAIDHHILEFKDRTMILFSNYCKNDNEMTFCFHKDNGHQIRAVEQVFPNRMALAWTAKSDYLVIPLKFLEEEVKIIEISYK